MLRCERHFSIWGAPWPQRTATPGSSTRENTPSDFMDKASRATLSAADVKLKAARVAQLMRIREMDRAAEANRESSTQVLSSRKRINEHEDENVPALKRLKFLDRTAKVKVESADEVPLYPTKEKDTPIAGSLTVKHNTRKRGRLSAAEEPLDTTHRNPPVDENGDDRRDKTFWPALPSLPPLGDGIKRTGLLNLRPNPNQVSRWRASPLRASHSLESIPTLVDDDTSEATSDEHPSTPENRSGLGSTPEVVDDVERHSQDPSEVCEVPPTSDEEEVDRHEHNDSRPQKTTISAFKGLGLIYKPSPLALSKRIWAPPALIADPDCEDLDSSVSEPSRFKKRRRNLVSEQRNADDSASSSPIVGRTSPSGVSIDAFSLKVKRGMFDDFDASSGEEDVILPGPSN